MMIDWNACDTVLLDMDGTLLDLNFDNHFWLEFVPLKYAEKNKISLTAAKTILKPQFTKMEGKLEWYCLDYWAKTLELDIVGLKNEIAALISVLPHVVEFLEDLRKAGKKILLVTNAHWDSLNLKMEKTCLQPFFDAIVCSHDFGVAKEHPNFWPSLQKQQGFDKQRTAMIDDNLAVLDSAKAFGIAYLITISKPDSQKPVKVIEDYPAIEDFRTLSDQLKKCPSN
jgi:putative hydrolase of the HAD superfamily